MRLSRFGMRTLMALILALAVAGGPSLGSMAKTAETSQSDKTNQADKLGQAAFVQNLFGSDGDDADQKQKRDGKNPPQLVTEAITAGVITTSGTVKVNDNVVPTGTTILSGSIIVTGSDGKASIDMGTQGILQMRPNTKLWLNVPGGPIKVDLRECGSITETVPAGVAALVAVDKQSNIHVSVDRGKVKVTRDGKDTFMKDKEEKTFDKVWLVTGISDSVFTLDCDEEVAAYRPWPMSLIGVIMGAGAITGVIIGKHNFGPTPKPTPPKPTHLFPS